MTDPAAETEAMHPLPTRPAVSREEARTAVRRMHARAVEREAGGFDWPEWKAWRDEGRGKQES